MLERDVEEVGKGLCSVWGLDGDDDGDDDGVGDRLSA